MKYKGYVITQSGHIKALPSPFFADGIVAAQQFAEGLLAHLQAKLINWDGYKLHTVVEVE